MYVMYACIVETTFSRKQNATKLLHVYELYIST